MKWKRVCMPCYKASVPRRGQSKKNCLFAKCWQRNKQYHAENFVYRLKCFLFSFSLQGRARVHCPGNPPSHPTPPPPKKKKKQKEKAVVCPNQTEAKSLSLVGRLQAKFWIFLLHLSIGCFMLLWKVLGLIEWFSCSKLTYLHPNCPKRPVKNHPIFMSFVLLVMSSVSQTIWHLLAQG